MKTYYSVTSSFNDRGEVRANITSSIEADEKPEGSFVSNCRKDVYVDWFESIEEAREFVEQSRNA